MSEKKRNYYTPAQKRSIEKYLREKVEDVHVHVKKGYKQALKDHAAEMNESLNQFCIRAFRETIERDNQEQQE